MVTKRQMQRALDEVIARISAEMKANPGITSTEAARRVHERLKKGEN